MRLCLPSPTQWSKKCNIKSVCFLRYWRFKLASGFWHKTTLVSPTQWSRKCIIKSIWFFRYLRFNLTLLKKVLEMWHYCIQINKTHCILLPLDFTCPALHSNLRSCPALHSNLIKPFEASAWKLHHCNSKAQNFIISNRTPCIVLRHYSYTIVHAQPGKLCGFWFIWGLSWL